MKKLLLFTLYILLLSVACQKTEEEPNPETEYTYLPYILAGQDTGIAVRYVNMDPDLHLFSYDGGTGKTELVDLNNDTIPDIKIEMRHTPESLLSYHDRTLSIVPMENSRVCVTGNSAYPLQKNDTISENREWSASKALLYDYSSQSYPYREDTTGFWYGRTDLYVGVEVQKDDHRFYGWININGKINAITEYAVTMPYQVKEE